MLNRLILQHLNLLKCKSQYIHCESETKKAILLIGVTLGMKHMYD